MLARLTNQDTLISMNGPGAHPASYFRLFCVKHKRMYRPISINCWRSCGIATNPFLLTTNPFLLNGQPPILGSAMVGLVDRGCKPHIDRVVSRFESLGRNLLVDLRCAKSQRQSVHDIAWPPHSQQHTIDIFKAAQHLHGLRRQLPATFLTPVRVLCELADGSNFFPPENHNCRAAAPRKSAHRNLMKRI